MQFLQLRLQFLQLLVRTFLDIFQDRFILAAHLILQLGRQAIGEHLLEFREHLDLESGKIDGFEFDEGPEPEDRSDLMAVAEILAGPADDAAIAALEARVDLDQFLLNMGIEAVILHWDGYTTANNYRLYHDPRTDQI